MHLTGDQTPNLATHAAIDGEVDGVRERDEEVGEQNEHVDDAVVEHAQVERGIEDVQHGEHGERDLDDEEARHDDDEHERGAVRVAQLAALARLPVLLEQLVPLLLGPSQRAEQQHVEHHERRARSQVYANHSEPKVHVVIHHLQTETRHGQALF